MRVYGPVPLRYGENPPQGAVFRPRLGDRDPLALACFEKVLGGQYGYVNLTDLDRLSATVVKTKAALVANSTSHCLAVAVKHGNACGAGVDPTPMGAVKRMIESDPVALFGGCVMLTFDLTRAHVEALHMWSGSRKLDMVIASGFREDAADSLRQASPNCKLLVNPALACAEQYVLSERQIRYVRGGYLEQDSNTFVLKIPPEWRDWLSEERARDLILGWGIGSTANSNSIVLVNDGMLLGSGIAQTSRVRACRVAVDNALESGHQGALQGSVAYSDSFFPFEDGPERLAHAGVRIIFATSGSVNDEKVRDFCARNGIMLFTLPDSEARGFFAH